MNTSMPSAPAEATARAFAAAGLQLSQPRPFSFERLVAYAKTLGSQPYVADKSLPADILEKIDYDAHGKIKFNTDTALFRRTGAVSRHLLPPGPLLPGAGAYARAGNRGR